MPPPHPLLRRPPRTPALALCAGILLSLPLSASWEIRTYEQRYGPNASQYSRMGSMFSEDIHVWTYTEPFARYHRMPERWIDPELEGAAALAYALKWDSGYVCGYGGSLDCRRRLRCVLEVLFEGDRGDLLRNDLTVNHNPFGKDRSARFLTPQREEDFAWMQQLRTSVDLAGSAHWYRQDTSGRWHYGGEARSLHYERRAYDLTNLSLQVDCQFGDWGPSRASRVKLLFTDAPVDGDEAGGWLRDGQLQPPAERIHEQVAWSGRFTERVQENQRNRYFIHNIPHDTHGDVDWYRDEFKAQTYEERFGARADAPHVEDPHVWAYTEAFAERFGMPREWITEGLEGVEALAYRVDKRTARFCGYGGNPEACGPFEFCMVEAYFPEGADIPWHESLPMNRGFVDVDGPLQKLSPDDSEYFRMRDVSQSSAFVYVINDEGQREQNVFLTGRMEVYRRPFSWLPIGRWEEAVIGPGSVFGYERRLEGYDVFEFNTSCTNWQRRRVLPGREREYFFTTRPLTIHELFHAREESRQGELAAYRWLVPDTVVERLYKRFENRRF